MREKESGKSEKTTGIYLKPDVVQMAKIVAVLEGTTQSQIVADALIEYFEKHKPQIQAKLQETLNEYGFTIFNSTQKDAAPHLVEPEST